MAFDDPIVWVLILGVVIFLFGSSKISQFAKSLGQARREFDNGFKGISSESAPPTGNVSTATAGSVPAAAVSAASATSPSATDPVMIAARNEGIDTTGKSREQVATELAWKLNKR